MCNICKSVTRMATATKLLSVPEAFSDGDFGLWLRKFELCSTANGWKEDEMLKRLPTLLSGKAFAVFERLGEDKESFKTLVESIKEAFGGRRRRNEQAYRQDGISSTCAKARGRYSSFCICLGDIAAPSSNAGGWKRREKYPSKASVY